MAYIGFDLDETLGRFISAHPFVFFVNPGPVYDYLLKGQAPFVPSEALRAKLEVAMNEFAKCLVATVPGILRPGILAILSKLSNLKDSGQVAAISIYSNNGNLGLLLLASAMIENALGKPGLFCNHIDWYNPMRSAEITPGRPGSAYKTGRVLRQSFLDPRCGSFRSLNAIQKAKTYFFDDTIHQDVLNEIGPANYFRVNPYKIDPSSVKPIESCLDTALRAADLDTDEEYLSYINPIAVALGSDPTKKDYTKIFTALSNFNRNYVPTTLKFSDDTDSILERISVLFPSPAEPAAPPAEEAPAAPAAAPLANNYGTNYFPVSDGGRRKIKRRHVVVKKYSKKRKLRDRKGPKRTRKN
jgi:hypothetical protein